MSEKWIDRSWKDIITENADDAIRFFKPELAEDRDYSKKILLVPTELPAIGGDSDKDMRNSDVCLSIPLKTGVEQIVAFHIEQQHEPVDDFALRMYQGHYRMSDKLKVPVTSLAIYTGNIKPVDVYTETCYGTELNFKYNVYHVASADVKDLERDERIFALVVLAARKMLEAGGDPQKRGAYSLELLKLLKERGYKSGYDIKKTRSLQQFIYRILRIKDENIDPKVREEWKMQLIPIDDAVREIQIRREEEIREILTDYAKQEGEEKKAFDVARRMLARKMSVSDIIDLTGLGEEDIAALS